MNFRNGVSVGVMGFAILGISILFNGLLQAGEIRKIKKPLTAVVAEKGKPALTSKPSSSSADKTPAGKTEDPKPSSTTQSAPDAGQMSDSDSSALKNEITAANVIMAIQKYFDEQTVDGRIGFADGEKQLSLALVGIRKDPPAPVNDGTHVVGADFTDEKGNKYLVNCFVKKDANGMNVMPPEIGQVNGVVRYTWEKTADGTWARKY